MELIEAGNLTGLLDLLAAKQRPLAELQRVQRAIDPFRAQDPAAIAAGNRPRPATPAPGHRGVRPAAAGDPRARKNRARRSWSRRRDEAAVRLQGMHAAGQARGAYAASGRTTFSQLDLLSDG